MVRVWEGLDRTTYLSLTPLLKKKGESDKRFFFFLFSFLSSTSLPLTDRGPGRRTAQCYQCVPAYVRIFLGVFIHL